MGNSLSGQKNHMAEPFTIGVLGGMGTYATIHIFEEYARRFPAEKEWDRPRIIIDNNCTMPSRVRAYLYDEKKEELVKIMTESINFLVKGGATHIIIGCNTAHLFVSEIIEKYPTLKGRIVSIIDASVRKALLNNVDLVYLLGSEGTVDSKIYQLALSNNGIQCITPTMKELRDIRNCIESVKQNRIGSDTLKMFRKLITKKGTILLGCTELPILLENCDIRNQIEYIDPISCVMDELYSKFIC